MDKKMITTSLIILTLASGTSFANYTKKGLPKPETTEDNPPLTQRPLTLPFNKISNDIIHRYEARRKIIDDSKALENEREHLQASKERFKKEKTYLLSGKF
ncbi:MAG TPA: hypothetical protein DD412_03570 [Holosporales bacterium]|nr:hypothetical protein [Holosporales bacterium]